jgi:hypothetical protein
MPKEPKPLSIENEVMILKTTKTTKMTQINNSIKIKKTSTSKPSNPISSQKAINPTKRTLSGTQNPIKK